MLDHERCEAQHQAAIRQPDRKRSLWRRPRDWLYKPSLGMETLLAGEGDFDVNDVEIFGLAAADAEISDGEREEIDRRKENIQRGAVGLWVCP